MANIVLNQSYTDQQQKAVKLVDLDNMVRWVAQYTLESPDNDYLNFLFRVGMPGKFPTGEWGFTVFGNSGMHIIPDPDKLDHRTSYRYGTIPRYDVKLASLWGVTAPMTVYNRELRLSTMNPEIWKALHLQAVARALPNYWKYLSYSVFGGKTNKTRNKLLLQEYIKQYIEPANGSNEGYPFYLSDGYGEINLKKVISKSKVKQHALKTELERINKLLYKDDAKVEAQVADYVDKKKWIKENLTPETHKSLAVYFKIKSEIQTILKNGAFEAKYKIESNKFEGYNVPITNAYDMILLLNRTEWKAMQDDFNFTELGKATFDISQFEGVNVLFCDDIDTNEALLFHKDLLQFWILPSETRYLTIPYEHEETTDYFYETRHTMDVVPIYPRIWFKLKA